MDVTQEIEQRAQWSAPAWAACWALCSISCVTSTLASVYDILAPITVWLGVAGLLSHFPLVKVATYRLEYRDEPKESTHFGSVSGSEVQNSPFSLSGIESLYRAEPKEPT